MYQMFLDDFFDIIRVDVAVPDSLRVDDDDWAIFATIHAASLVYADLILALEF